MVFVDASASEPAPQRGVLRFRSLRSNRLVWISWRVFLTPCNALFLNAWELMAPSILAYPFDAIISLLTSTVMLGALYSHGCFPALLAFVESLWRLLALYFIVYH